MSISNLADERQLRHSDAHPAARETDRAALTASLLREKELLSEMSVLSLQQDLMAQEFDHRLGNSLQMIVSLLSLQSLAAPTPEAANSADDRGWPRRRVWARAPAIGFPRSSKERRVQAIPAHALRRYRGPAAAEGCWPGGRCRRRGDNPADSAWNTARLSGCRGITNSVKYATGDIIVRIETLAPTVLLSIVDDGPGLPADFDPMKQKGLGMKLIQSLTKQIGGTLEVRTRRRRARDAADGVVHGMNENGAPPIEGASFTAPQYREKTQQ